MVWAAFNAKGTTKIAFLTGRQKSDDYIYTVSKLLLPFDYLHYGTDSSISRMTPPSIPPKAFMDFLQEQDVYVLELTPRSSDLDPIENLWSILTRRVYSNGRQVNNVAELRAAIEDAWKISIPNIIRSLIDSMPRRCQEVI
ncbi:Mismatch repair endonuclease PMS2 [Phytophthora nicotianae]|uniref:Mismatch repair endonuclease PMS2 n=1 Tax=Phytophthora nicotianae TaxID=4792 RepID=A0A0W8DDJ9_PHYNI|nr:Mismatch repair endonuclease PMS2 [Phytophthora nicotianae]